jgi:hypothetical protein
VVNDQAGQRVVIESVVFEVLGKCSSGVYGDLTKSRKEACDSFQVVSYAVLTEVDATWLSAWDRKNLEDVFERCISIPPEEVKSLRSPSPLLGLLLDDRTLLLDGDA